MKIEDHEIGTSVIVTVDPNNGYRPRFFSLDEWAEYEDKLLHHTPSDRAVRAVQRLVVGLATECTIGKNHHIDLPAEIEALAQDL